MSEGSEEFARMLRNSMRGLCPCGRRGPTSRVGGHCCRECRGISEAHGKTCEKRNPERVIAA
jgi:hypothetical protein